MGLVILDNKFASLVDVVGDLVTSKTGTVLSLLLEVGIQALESSWVMSSNVLFLFIGGGNSCSSSSSGSGGGGGALL